MRYSVGHHGHEVASREVARESGGIPAQQVVIVADEGSGEDRGVASSNLGQRKASLYGQSVNLNLTVQYDCRSENHTTFQGFIRDFQQQTDLRIH